MSTLNQEVINKIMNRAIEINKSTTLACRDFIIMKSNKFLDTLILRWNCIDIQDLDKPKQCFRYECFELDGSPKLCSIHYSNQEEANQFIWSLISLYHQKFAIDHIYNYV